MAKKQTKRTSRWKRKNAHRKKVKDANRQVFIKSLLFKKFTSVSAPEFTYQELNIKSNIMVELVRDWSFGISIEEILLHQQDIKRILFRKFD